MPRKKKLKMITNIRAGESLSKLLKNGTAKLNMKISSKKAIAMNVMRKPVLKPGGGICTCRLFPS